MSNFFEYTSASLKVAYDKVSDYVSYYTSFSKENDDNELSDVVGDYNDILKVDEYTNEEKNKRILSKVGILDQYSVFFDEPTFIIDNIYLGSAFNAASYSVLKKLDIKTIINMTNEISKYYPDEFEYKQYGLYDNNKNSITKYLEQVYQDILKYKEQDGNILVHCFMGASRSATVVLYYLIKDKNMTFDEGLKFLKEKRIVVNPTFRFTKDLANSVSAI